MRAPDWQVIGLHDVGGEYVRKLNGQSGTHAASEAIWIQSIAKALADFFPIARPSLGVNVPPPPLQPWDRHFGKALAGYFHGLARICSVLRQ